MRLWSLHPQYLDGKGLVALWREGLLAKKVLEQKTDGYKNHPQLERFKRSQDPLNAINFYLSEVYREAERRGYTFNREKIRWTTQAEKIEVTQGQLLYELNHLRKKLKNRACASLHDLPESVDPHPLFTVIAGEIEEWERQKETE
jgi:hypothetical protein